jgi:hypothetical protein
MKVSAEWSQRLLRKGVLVHETYRLFAEWDLGMTTEENLERGLAGRATTQGWDTEVVATVRRRVRDFDRIRSLIILAQRGLPLNDWRDCLRLWVGATEEPFHSFATGWLFDEKVRGRSVIRSEELVPVIDAAASRRPGNAKPISDYSRIRAARDLLKTASDLGMIEGAGPARTYSGIAMSDDVLVYYVHLIAELEGGVGRVPDSKLWRLAYLAPQDVQLMLLHLHQFRRLDYQVAGSLAQLTLPASSADHYAQQVAL